MKILVICESICFDGGAQRSTIRFMRGLANKGHSIILYMTFTNKDDVSQLKKQIPGIEIMVFISNKALLTSDINIAIYYPKLKKYILKDNPDVIYSINPTLIANRALKIAKKYKIPFVSHIHADNNLMILEINFFMRYFVNQLSKYINRIYNKSDYIIYPTKSTYLKNKHLIKNKKVSIISNGVDKTIFYPAKRKENKIKHILAVGRLIPLKNFKVLLDAIINLKGVHLTIVGDGVLKKEYLKYPSNLVTFIPSLSTLELAKLYRAADLFVLPSIQETESMVALEAIASGLPIIVSNHDNNAAKKFVDGNGYLFQYDSSMGLRKKILGIFGDVRLRNRFGKKSLKLSKNYSLDSSINKLEKVFLKVVNKNKKLD